MKEQIRKILIDNQIDKKGSETTQIVNEICDLIFKGKENHFTVSKGVFEKMPVEGGHIYYFWDDKYDEWNTQGVFVPIIPE